ncbi:L-glutamate gamma-semialdehyde dehydrogenase [candidate division KSB1 bacterium]|nr:L-glutamate gamma-semialdehyde dehydrogenase [candidate division KSB1 bacterium]NIR71445.1 L-glutamate gamma-semialdehyde dehydrogenase [candidate division KSB1 bacterium]NIS23366.1 L-glutamate gamma-semialdehyde dehydrogenase [candidate division KSB1 bacterium]NIT70257.1 L-glutamate gamma-semialdehyde dehydrogenase [candidate division KSB1 bacterium]NIU23980.1 L-glutamate gamma-semialdehyde dehydrogenase [candidate division KSB1 bacterium]
MVSEFRNHPLTDFSKPENKAKMQEALESVKSEFDRIYPLYIGGKEVETGDLLKSYNPCKKDEVVGTFHKAGKKEVDQAIEAAQQTFKSWSFEYPQKRADFLFKAAEVMRRRQFELNAWMIHETGKNWVEADADTAEAIDFLEFYGREMLRYADEQPVTPVPGEENELIYIPLGVGAVIPPWNFPLAILTGMTSAAIVTGNCVLLKPASDSPTIGHKYLEIIQEAGLPPGVLNYMPGSGGTIGDHIVSHPKIRFIAFTGSKEVGLRINELAAKHQPGQIWLKRVIAEMGGKDAIVVDREADLDEAVEGVAVSAFGYQGQKCSACSRAIVDESIYDEFVEKLKERSKKISIGPVDDPNNYMGAVINKAALDKTLKYIDIGKKEGRLIYGGEKGSDSGYYVQPTIFTDVDSKARLAQEEVFAPVLAVTKARDYDHALEIANDTEYGLTGSVYTKNEDKIEKAKKLFHVGNLYFNRKCTGALVGGHPFGGFNMSGTDSKAGGRDYLLLFMQAKSMSKKV